MSKLAQFTPVIDDLQERVVEYYSKNQIKKPDNKYFLNHFKMPETESPQGEPLPGVPTMNAKDFFLNQPKASYEYKLPPSPIPNKKTINLPAVEKTPFNFTIGVKDSVADRHNNPGNLMFAGQKGAVRGEKRGSGY